MKKFGRENNFKNMQKYFMIFMVLWSWFPNQVLKIQKMWGEGQRDAGHQHCGKNWIAPSDVYHTSRLKSWGAEGPTNFFWFFPLRAFISGTMVNLIGAHKKETTKNNVESSWGLKTFGLRLVSVWWIVGIPKWTKHVQWEGDLISLPPKLPNAYNFTSHHGEPTALTIYSNKPIE